MKGLSNTEFDFDLILNSLEVQLNIEKQKFSQIQIIPSSLRNPLYNKNKQSQSSKRSGYRYLDLDQDPKVVLWLQSNILEWSGAKRVFWVQQTRRLQLDGRDLFQIRKKEDKCKSRAKVRKAIKVSSRHGSYS